MFVHSDFVLKAGMRVFIENCRIDICLVFLYLMWVQQSVRVTTCCIKFLTEMSLTRDYFVIRCNKEHWLA